ncbi:MAG: hypothetical protein K2P78_04000 [Gemmataceae bacterium]|nr:hypothetical protein [Gemmataceae bacterium]
MFARIGNGWELARSSWHVLMRDKHLILFPVVSGILFALVVASFLVPLAVLVDPNNPNQGPRFRGVPVWTFAVAFAFYFCTYFVTVFCNSALLSCAFLRFEGENPTVADGFGAAVARLPQILAWALVSATVGVVLKVVEQAPEKAGAFVASILGTAWSIMTFFVVPVLVVEKVGPVDAVKRSMKLLRKTWGEALVGRGGIGLIMFLLAIPIILVAVAGVYFLVTGLVPVGVALLAVAVVAFLMHMAVGSALHTILLAALYEYADRGYVPNGFDRHNFESAFEPNR